MRVSWLCAALLVPAGCANCSERASGTGTGADPLVVAPDTPNARAVVTDGDNAYFVAGEQVKRAPLSGTRRPATLYAGEHPYGLALDGDFLFFTDRSAGRVAKVTKSGDLRDVVVIAEHESLPGPVAVRGGCVYWATDAGEVRTAPVGGGQAASIAPADRVAIYPHWTGKGAPMPGIGHPFAIVVDDEAAYVSDFDGGHVFRVPLDGNAPPTMILDVTRAAGLALDGEFLYVADAGPSNADRGEIVRVKRASPSEKQVLASNLAQPRALAVAGGDVAFVAGNGVFRIPAAGGGAVLVRDEKTSLASATSIALDAKGTTFPGDGRIERVVR